MTPQRHPDLDLDWCNRLLNEPDVEFFPADSTLLTIGSVAFFQVCLFNDQAIRSHMVFRRPVRHAEAVSTWEDCCLFSVGTGVDGKAGRAHGGLNSLLLDHFMGVCAYRQSGPEKTPPATASLTVEYKAPMATPGVYVCRAWVVGHEGRKMWVSGVIQDGSGMALAVGKGLWVLPRPASL